MLTCNLGRVSRCFSASNRAGIVGFNDEAESVNVTKELVRRGYSEADIDKIWGGNFLRVFRQVGAAAKKSS